eukprot:TRINITY_DN7029_c0_g1_i1.p1 TRINITY_DN7029_c0_g1~~TRINITY_DN7029_c0_g1_i1.p1  ORF type:complete len:262 (-),score=63.88 TRINITY_DN7029_c0_g1_i1:32-817(-)
MEQKSPNSSKKQARITKFFGKNDDESDEKAEDIVELKRKDKPEDDDQESVVEKKKRKKIVIEKISFEEDKVFDLGQGTIIHYYPHFVEPKTAAKLFEELLQLDNWIQGDLKMFGKPLKTPRLQSWMADESVKPGSLYQSNKQIPWSDEMKALKSRVEKISGTKYDFVLLNLYRNGQDHIGWHADRECRAPGKNVVASLSLGATRRFLLKHATDESLPQKEFSLRSGALIIMSGTCQTYWKHTVPKESKVNDPRINLTFRQV